MDTRGEPGPAELPERQGGLVLYGAAEARAVADWTERLGAASVAGVVEAGARRQPVEGAARTVGPLL